MKHKEINNISIINVDVTHYMQGEGKLDCDSQKIVVPDSPPFVSPLCIGLWYNGK